jgi:phage-related protein
MASPTETFIGTLTQTPPLALALQKNLQRLKDGLDRIIKVLTYTKTVADDLDKLDDTLKTVTDLLTVASVVPEVGEAAAALKNSISVLSREVSPARKAADELEAKVKPLRDALGKLDPVLADGIKLTGQIASTSQAFLEKFTAIVNCINALPEGEYKTKGLAYLDQFSSDAEPIVANLNTAMDTANKAIDTFYSALAQIETALSPLSAIASAVEQVLSVLNPIIGPLQSLVNALETIEIPIPIPYPHMVKLYDVFKDFGAFIDLAMKPIQDLVNQLLSALHITLPSIPGLSDLINLHIDIPAIPDFSALLLAITNPFNQLALLIPKFSLNCPPAAGESVPAWTGH